MKSDFVKGIFFTFSILASMGISFMGLHWAMTNPFHFGYIHYALFTLIPTCYGGVAVATFVNK